MTRTAQPLPRRRQVIKELTLLRDAVDAEPDRFGRTSASLIAWRRLDALSEIDERDTIGAPLTICPIFATLAARPSVRTDRGRAFGSDSILNQRYGAIRRRKRAQD